MLFSPFGDEMRRWIARHSKMGVVEIDFDLTEETTVGKWTLLAALRGSEKRTSGFSRETAKFEVRGRDQSRAEAGFSVNLWSQSSIVASDGSLRGWVQARSSPEGIGIMGAATMGILVRGEEREMH